ncbi:MAG: monovalent cation/H+ antiporter subunit D, partial [Gammaproteobacteria bacterium]
MNHLPILPILMPAIAGSLMVLLTLQSLAVKRILSGVATVASLAIALWLWHETRDGVIHVYALGNWAPPFGIVLVLDRLSALMLALTASLAVPVILYAVCGTDRQGRNFHALFQFQLMGINGAFLAGDLFNLFVFFEILLIASYALLAHGGGPARIRASVHYVLLNLGGSALFLVAIGMLYGLTGQLNLAALALAITLAPVTDTPLLAAAGLLLLLVFGLKAALLPLYFWLPRAYAEASAPVACLFAVMTKVGLYAVLRVHGLLFGTHAGELAGLVIPWVWPVALLTMALGAIGALAARNLQTLLAYLVILSVGSLFAGMHSTSSVAGMTALLYYLLHSTWITGGLFLLAGILGQQRGSMSGLLKPGPQLQQPATLGTLFFIAAIAVAGLPPLSGFIGKLLLLQASGPGGQGG